MQLDIDLSERWLIVGKTGSGKTEFMKYVLREIEKTGIPIVIVDVKEMWLGKVPAWEEENDARKAPGTVDKPHLVTSYNSEYAVQVLQPDVDEADGDDTFPKLCNDIVKELKGPMNALVLYLDESEGLATANHVPAHLRRVWKQGRALGLMAIVGTQAPKGIPRMFKSQAEKFIGFRVGDEDADTVAELLHTTEDDVKSLQKYEYLFYDINKMETAEWNPPLPKEAITAHGQHDTNGQNERNDNQVKERKETIA